MKSRKKEQETPHAKNEEKAATTKKAAKKKTTTTAKKMTTAKKTAGEKKTKKAATTKETAAAQAITIPPDPERDAKARTVVLTLNDDELAATVIAPRFGLTIDEARALIVQIKEELKERSAGDRKEKLGEALAKLAETYKIAIQTQDATRALQVVKEQNKILGLYNQFVDTKERKSDAEKDAARAVLLSAAPEKEDAPLDELARAVVYKLIATETARR